MAKKKRQKRPKQIWYQLIDVVNDIKLGFIPKWSKAIEAANSMNRQFKKKEIPVPNKPDYALLEDLGWKIIKRDGKEFMKGGIFVKIVPIKTAEIMNEQIRKQTKNVILDPVEKEVEIQTPDGKKIKAEEKAVIS